MNLSAFALPYRLHVGCGGIRIDGFVNVDTRATEATDVVHDCKDLSIFPDSSASIVFSHAFFEHLYLQQHLPLLADIHRVLVADGIVHFVGIPDFEAVARCYLEGRRGNVSEKFGLWEAYRNTHGDPEQKSDWWVQQLHKALFDAQYLAALLVRAGFARPALYRYAYADEPNATNLAFLARRSGLPIRRDEAMTHVNLFSPISRPHQIEWLA